MTADFNKQSAVLTQQSEKLIQYNILKREVDSNRQLFDSTLQKGKETSIASALRASNARIVDAAFPSKIPFRPNYPINLALGLLAGSFLGIGWVLAKEILNRSVQTPGETSHFLSVPELGVIPSAASSHSYRRFQGRVTRLIPHHTRPQAGVTTLNPITSSIELERLELVTLQDKRSSLAESFPGYSRINSVLSTEQLRLAGSRCDERLCG